ncbi:opioid growth factor receptor-related protein, partial [Phenylobacterium sp.]
MDNVQLERRHDYIQWLFPLPEASSAVPGAPVLSADDVMQIRSSDIAMTNLRAAAARMRDFYARTRHWLAPADHNHLRITRIIKSLRLLAGDAEADAFKTMILDTVGFSGANISARSM